MDVWVWLSCLLYQSSTCVSSSGVETMLFSVLGRCWCWWHQTITVELASTVARQLFKIKHILSMFFIIKNLPVTPYPLQTELMSPLLSLCIWEKCLSTGVWNIVLFPYIQSEYRRSVCGPHPTWWGLVNTPSSPEVISFLLSCLCHVSLYFSSMCTQFSLIHSQSTPPTHPSSSSFSPAASDHHLPCLCAMWRLTSLPSVSLPQHIFLSMINKYKYERGHTWDWHSLFVIHSSDSLFW